MAPSEIMTAHTAEQACAYLKGVAPGSGLFFDVDNTLITPQSALFRATSPHRSLIDDIKKQKDKFPNFEEIVSNWRLARKTMLVDARWPEILYTLKQSCGVYGLTKMDTGPFGSIPSMEEWRYQELTKMGLTFSHQSRTDHPLIKSTERFPHSAVYHQGIFMTGSYTKKAVAQAFLKSLRFSEIGMVDDRLEELEGVQSACEEHGIPFKGVLFKGAEKLEGVPDLKVAEFQKQYLIQTAQWLEDEEAIERLRRSKSVAEF